MKKLCIAAVAFSLLLATNGVAQVLVSQIPGYATADGEFNVNPVVGAGYHADVLVAGGYETFCLARNTAITVPGIYYATVDTNGIMQPLNVAMSAGSAWLYSQFATGVLPGYNYAGFATIDPGNPAATLRMTSAFYFQRAIWTLDGTYSYGSLADDITFNPFLSLAAAHFGGGVAGLAVAMLPNPPGGSGVGALNLNVINPDLSTGAFVQPMLMLLAQAPPPPPQTNHIGRGDTATIGFWHNKNGQALINAMPNSPALGNWLASSFPCLYGNLAGKSDSQIAAQFLTYFNVTGTKTKAQVLGAALACYVTSSTLSGTTIAGKYGFNLSPGGTGGKTYNTGSLGTVLGLSNNTDYTVLQLLQAANANCPWNAAVFNALNVIFDGINESGDII